jgi:hypothetical protein
LVKGPFTVALWMKAGDTYRMVGEATVQVFTPLARVKVPPSAEQLACVIDDDDGAAEAGAPVRTSAAVSATAAMAPTRACARRLIGVMRRSVAAGAGSM